MKTYRTIAFESKADLVIKKSRFLSFAYPIESAEQAQNALDALRKAHYTATHHCYAYMLGENADQMKYSDDNEPQGTAGLPILDVLQKKQLTNLLVVVVRYFGGIQLGANGLVRAYGAACAAAIDAAGICEMAVADALLIQCPYATYAKVERYIKSSGLIVVKSDFADSVRIHAICQQDKTEAVLREIRDMSSGSATCNILEQTLVKRPVLAASV